MRKLIYQMMITVDGYFAGPEGEVDWHHVDAEYGEYARDFLSRIDTLLFGRVTYELMAHYWDSPFARENDPNTAGYMNGLTKIVFSNTLERAEWENTRLVKGNIGEEVSKLKRQQGKDIGIFGSSDLALTLIPLNLIDEYNLIVNPIVLGKGKSFLHGLSDRLKLELLGTRAFRSGNVLLRYRGSA